MKKTISLTLMILLLLQVVPVYANQNTSTERSGAKRRKIDVISAKLITDKDIEIKFDKELINVDEASDFKIYVDGVKLASDKYTFIAYFDQMATIRLIDSITDPGKKIEVKIVDKTIQDVNGVKPNKNKITITRDPYYKKSFIAPQSGIEVIGSENVKDESLKSAATLIDIMLAKRPDIASAMVDNGAKLAVIAKSEGETAFYIPEHREWYNPAWLYVEGYGGTMDIPITTCTDANIERWLDVTTYDNESLVAHEFGHAIHLIGIYSGDSDLYKEVTATYENAKTKGLWPNTYLISNEQEYFATGTQMWFNVMSESSDGSFDGVRGPINTREELKNYDVDLYNLLAKIYNETTLPVPWDSTPDVFDETGAKY